jgi:hypothetical protein
MDWIIGYFSVGVLFALVALANTANSTRAERIASVILFPFLMAAWPVFLAFRLIEGKW